MKLGIFFVFQIYNEKIESIETSLGKRIVMTLTRNIQGKYHRDFWTIFFSSLGLIKNLLKNNVYACETVSGNKKGLSTDQIYDKLMKRGDSEGRVSTKNLSWIK